MTDVVSVTPVDHDPFTPQLVPVDHDPFASVDAMGNNAGASLASAPQGLITSLAKTWPARLAQGAWSAAKLPGDVYAGRIDPMSDEGIGRAADLAGLVMTGGAPRLAVNLADHAPAYSPGIKSSDLASARGVRDNWQTTAPKDMETIVGHASGNQDALAAVSQDAAQLHGADFANPGAKSVPRLQEKISSGKAPESITDAVRAGFMVSTPEQSDAIVNHLAKHFEVADEGWAQNGAGYFDRKSIIRFPSGQMGEIQMWPPGMFEAKEFQRGHNLYQKSQSLEPGSADHTDAYNKMRALYGSVKANLGPEWDGLFGEGR